MSLLKSKHTLILCVLLIAYNSLKAQNSYFGLKAGYNTSSLRSSNNSDIKLNDKNTLNIASVFSFRSWGAKWGFTIEPGYIKKGVSADSINYNLNYLNAPFLIDFYPINKIKLSLGPEISFLASAKNTKKKQGDRSIVDTYENLWELSGTASASYALDYFIDLGLRYNFGFTKIAQYDLELDRRNLRNQYFQVFVIFKIAN